MTDTFAASRECPRCGTFDIHLMREPNPEPPKQVREPETHQIIRWGGEVVGEYHDGGLDRWDERPYETIRMCTRCGHEWGEL